MVLVADWAMPACAIMPKPVSVQEYLNPPMGQVTAEVWQSLFDLGSMETLQAALSCALRGDSASLARLCDVLVPHGARALQPSDTEAAVDLRAVRPKFLTIKAARWADPALASSTLPMETAPFNDVQLERLVALCLSRPEVNGHVMQPRTLVQDQTGWNEKLLVPYHPVLSAAKQDLLCAAIGLFAHDANLSSGEYHVDTQRLFAQVTASVACPQVRQVFQAAGFNMDVLHDGQGQHYLGRVPVEDSLEVMAFRRGNPFSAWEIVQGLVSRSTSPEAYAERLEKLFKDLVDADGRFGPSPFAQWLQELRDETGDEALAADARFQALAGLCHLYAHRGSDEDIVARSVELAALHVRYVCREGTTSAIKSWCEPFVHELTHPILAIEAHTLSKVVHNLMRDDENFVANVDVLLAAHCTAAFKALQPALHKILGPAVLGCMENLPPRIDPWHRLAEPMPWCADLSPARWKAMLTLIEDAGINPGAVLQGQWSERDSWYRTTLLHLIAQAKDEGIIERMAAVLETGMDAHALDGAAREASSYLEPADQQRWHELCASYEAQRIARQAAEELLPPPGPP